MNGREQVERYSELWKPDQIGGHRIGDVVRLAGGDGSQFEIVGIDDPLVTLRSSTGREVRAGWRALKRVRRKGR